MIPYITVVIICLFSASLAQPISISRSATLSYSNRSDSKSTPAQGLVPLAALLALGTLRFGIGSDYEMYHRMYTYSVIPGNISDSLSTIPQEWLFVSVEAILKGFGVSATWFLAVSFAGTLILVFLGCRAVSPNLGLSLGIFVLLCFYTGSFNYVRQAIAVALVFWAFTGGKYRPFLKYATILLASGFHITAILAGVVLLVAERLKVNSVSTFVWIPIGGLLLSALLDIPSTASFFTELNSRYGEYLSLESEGLGFIFIASSRLVSLAGIFYLVPVSRMSQTLKTFSLFSSIGLGLLLVANTLSVLVRVELYFGLFLIAAIPMAFRETKRGVGPKILLICILIVYFVLHVLRFDEVYPYISIFSGGAS